MSNRIMNRRNAVAKAALVELVHGCGDSLGYDALDGLSYSGNGSIIASSWG